MGTPGLDHLSDKFVTFPAVFRLNIKQSSGLIWAQLRECFLNLGSFKILYVESTPRIPQVSGNPNILKLPRLRNPGLERAVFLSFHLSALAPSLEDLMEISEVSF